jgi:putative endonuclease
MADPYYVYILASRRNGTLYVGVTNDLSRRVAAHKTKAVPGFTARYNGTNWCLPKDILRSARRGTASAV